MKDQPEKKKPRLDPDLESDVIGADAADATSGVPESAEEWAAEQPLTDEPTRPLDAGEPSPYQPAAATPEAEDSQEPAPAESRAPKKS